MFRTDMIEMNIQPVDLGDELRELHPLRCIRDVALMRLRNSVSSDSGTYT